METKRESDANMTIPMESTETKALNDGWGDVSYLSDSVRGLWFLGSNGRVGGEGDASGRVSGCGWPLDADGGRRGLVKGQSWPPTE